MTPTKIDQEIIEEFFKALGWKHHKAFNSWEMPEPIDVAPPNDEGKFCWQKTVPHLPNILSNYDEFKKHVQDMMEEEGLDLLINPQNLDGIKSVSWINYRMHIITRKEIKEGHILRASVITATRYLKEVK